MAEPDEKYELPWFWSMNDQLNYSPEEAVLGSKYIHDDDSSDDHEEKDPNAPIRY